MRSQTKLRKDTRTYPDDDGSRFIASADLEVRSFADVVEQELKEVVGLFLLETDN